MKTAMKLFSAAVLLGTMLIPTSCNKSIEPGKAGELITFGSYTNGALTRTEYGGKDNDASNIEPIWWSANDEVKIVSDKAIVTNTSDQNYSNYKFSEYVSVNGTQNKSRGKFVNSGTNGLAWVDGEDTYTFYAVYPTSVNLGYNTGNLGSVTGTIPAAQAVSAHEYAASTSGTAKDWYYVANGKYTVYEPAMTNAIMTAKATDVASGTKPVALTFDPAFSAFEFTFDSADENTEITLTSFKMESTSSGLAGTFTGNAGDKKFAAVQNASKSVTLNNPSVLGTVKSGEPKTFSIFTIAQDITNLKIYFSDTDTDGSTRTRVLALNDKNGNPLTFEGGKKYRIRGLRLPGNKYQFSLTLNGVVQEWTVTSLNTVFTEQVQCSALTFDKSAREMTDEYKAGNGGKTNHYQSPAPVGDGRWQVRTLNNANMDGESYDYFTVTFSPSAPLGGYWHLDTHGNEYFTVQMVADPTALEPDLTPLPEFGNILNQKVVLRITPNWTKINEADASTEIGLYFDCYFYTNVDSDPLDANTEFQDIHGAGTYSYWLLTVQR